jgi:hypothetical protein
VRRLAWADTGSKLVDEAGSTINEIVDAVKRVTDIVGKISSASQETKVGATAPSPSRMIDPQAHDDPPDRRDESARGPAYATVVCVSAVPADPRRPMTSSMASTPTRSTAAPSTKPLL